MRGNRLLVTALVLVLLATATATPSRAHEANPSRYNYGEHVRPIFVEHCASCHRPGGIAPMSLLEFQEAVPWANAIKLQLLEQTMPPWLPAEGVGRFRHTRSLTAEEVDIIVDWAVGQTPEGEPLTAEETPEVAASAAAPPVDVTLEPGEPVVLTEDEFEKIACVVYPVGVDASRIVTSFVVRPELRTVLRRATIYSGTSCEEGTPLATWLPDQSRVGFPSGSGIAIAPAESLAVELSYVKGWEDDGKRLEDRTRIGLTFDAEAEPTELVHIEGSSYELETARRLVALYPAPEGAENENDNDNAEPLRIDAVFPGGERRALLVIERYDAAWREKYLLETPLSLPAGAELKTSRPGVWADFARDAPSLDDR